MGKMMVMGSGGGDGSDECTATRAEVLKGYMAITGDSDDEPVEGTLELDGDAADSQVLQGRTYYNTDAKQRRTGGMKNNGAISGALNCGQSLDVPAGFTAGGRVTANSLASQTPGNAHAGAIVAGYNAWVNGANVAGGLVVNSILSFSAATYSTNQILLQWQVPYVAAGKPLSGVFVNYSTGGYPGTGGTRIYTGVGSNASPGGISQAIVGMPAAGTGYFFSLTPYVTTNHGDIYGATLHAYAATTNNGDVSITNSCAWTVPNGVRIIDIFCVGGGQSGATGNNSVYGNDGGNGGQTNTIAGVAVIPGETLNIVVGAGGSGRYRTGGDTCVYRGPTLLASALGGRSPGSGVRTGSAGGGGSIANISNPVHATMGASDGRDVIQDRRSPILGQGYTTRAFGESWNTLYSGGGGGGGCRNDFVFGAGGDGGGGAGSASSNVAGGNGAYGTGGGGGAGYSVGGTRDYPSGAGGSGLVRIRW